MRKSISMKQSQKEKKQTNTPTDDLEEIPKALGLKSLDKLMSEPPELTTEEVAAIAKIAIGMIH
jgi:hypothetical protein